MGRSQCYCALCGGPWCAYPAELLSSEAKHPIRSAEIGRPTAPPRDEDEDEDEDGFKSDYNEEETYDPDAIQEAQTYWLGDAVAMAKNRETNQ